MPYGNAPSRRLAICISLIFTGLTGCAAFRPMAGVPARYVPDDLKVGDRTGKRTINLSLLSQGHQAVHLVDAGDVLGVYVGGVLGKIDENPQVQFPQNAEYRPAAGIPVTVREDGTISLPLIGALSVRGLSERQTEDAIRKAYTNHPEGREFLLPGHERILVSLQRPRHTQVMVIRQDSRSEPLANAAVGLLNLGTSKRGTGKVVSLPAYKNDVLNALIATDGLPGLDAENAVYIIRRQAALAGQDPFCLDGVDPDELIRQSRAAEKPTIRGQNSDGWDYRRQSSGENATPYTGFYRGESQDVSSRSFHPAGDLWDRGSQQQSFEPRLPETENRFSPGQNAYQQSQALSRSSEPGVEAAGYQNGPRGSASNIPPRWNTGNPQQGQAFSPPVPGYSTQNPPMNPQSGMPVQQGVPNSPGQFGSPDQSGQPAWPSSQQPPIRRPPSGTFLPGPGYSTSGSGSPQDPTGFDTSAPPGDLIDAPLRDGSGLDTDGPADERRIIRIPIRLGPGEHVDIKKEDIILHEGDIVFIESRDTEVFFTGGLLGGGQYTLPRDFDLDILQALSIATSRAGASGAARQVGGVSALNSDVSISPSNAIVIRKLPEGGEVPIKVDLYRARADLSERITIQPGDYIYLQYTPLEAIAAFFERHLLEGAIFGVLSQNLNRTK